MKVGLISIIILSFFLIQGLIKEYKEETQYRSFLEDMRSVNVTIKLPRPKCGQEDLDKAMTYFSIAKPYVVKGPFYKKDEADTPLGWILVHPMYTNRKVEIFCKAFSSWGRLGAILAHEIEIHGNQKFILIRPERDTEREAYLYPVYNRKRFNLTKFEVRSMISSYYDFYGNKEELELRDLLLKNF